MAQGAFVDAHVHFFDLQEPSLHYSWLQPEVRALDPIGPVGALQSQRYWPEDFLAESRFSEVEAVIHVDAASDQPDPVAETRWIQAFNDRLGVPHAHVARCDLASPDAAAIIDRHREYPVLRGVRDLRYDGYLSDAAWERGFALLAGTGLVCCMDPLLEHMSHAATLIAAHESVAVCIDHASYPRRRDDDYFRAWRDGMRAIARNPNAVVKISGLGMVDHAWTVDSIRPWAPDLHRGIRRGAQPVRHELAGRSPLQLVPRCRRCLPRARIGVQRGRARRAAGRKRTSHFQSCPGHDGGQHREGVKT